jgi:hypothetical protein
MELHIRDVNVSSHIERAGFKAVNVVTVLHRPTGIPVTVRGERNETLAYAICWHRLEKIVKMAKPIDWKKKQNLIANDVVAAHMAEFYKDKSLPSHTIQAMHFAALSATKEALTLYHKELVK